MDHVIQNLRDRGEAFGKFLVKRREIISKLQQIHKIKKQQLPQKKRITLNEQQKQLLIDLDSITEATERRLTEIRNRRNLIQPSNASDRDNGPHSATK